MRLGGGRHLGSGRSLGNGRSVRADDWGLGRLRRVRDCAATQVTSGMVVVPQLTKKQKRKADSAEIGRAGLRLAETTGNEI